MVFSPACDVRFSACYGTTSGGGGRWPQRCPRWQKLRDLRGILAAMAPRASRASRLAGRISSDSAPNGRGPTACKQIRREEPARWQPSRDLRGIGTPIHRLLSQVVAFLPLQGPNRPDSLASRTSPAAHARNGCRLSNGTPLWSEAHERCWRCGSKKSLQRCHIVAHSLHGADDPSNLVILCSECHAESPGVDAPEIMWDWLRAYRAVSPVTFWVEQGFREYEFMYKRSVQEELDFLQKHGVELHPENLMLDVSENSGGVTRSLWHLPRKPSNLCGPAQTLPQNEGKVRRRRATRGTLVGWELNRPTMAAQPRLAKHAGLCGTFAGSIPTTCNHIRRETPTKWRPSYNLQKERPSPGPLSSQIAVLPPSLAPNSPKSIASRASVATLASCSYTTDAVCPHQRDSVSSICLIQSSRQSTIDFSAPE